MENLPINILDVGVIILLLLGAITGLILGFIRGGLFVISWLGAAIATFFLFPFVKPYSRQYIEHNFFADIISGLIVFVIAIIFLFLLSSVISSWVRKSRLNALDRSLGMLAGIITSSLLLVGGFIITEKIWPPKDQPPWVSEAKVLPLIRKGAEVLTKLLPLEFQLATKSALKSKTSKTRKLIEKEAYDRLIRPHNKKSITQERSGYDINERRGIENLLDRTQ
ncbi:MAG: CvpA family protein [Pseudomonadota bacterium]|nr:CvpA family protein [Pseudomonadota bacterium]